jgi:hypothetical protein
MNLQFTSSSILRMTDILIIFLRERRFIPVLIPGNYSAMRSFQQNVKELTQSSKLLFLHQFPTGSGFAKSI